MNLLIYQKQIAKDLSNESVMKSELSTVSFWNSSCASSFFFLHAIRSSYHLGFSAPSNQVFYGFHQKLYEY